MKTIGIRTNLLMTFCPIIFVLCLVLIDKKHNFTMLYYIVPMVAAYGFIFFKTFRISNNAVIVSSTFNPFKRRVVIPIESIIKVLIKRRTTRGGSTKFIFLLKDKELSFLTTMIVSDEKKIVKLLNDLDVTTDTMII